MAQHLPLDDLYDHLLLLPAPDVTETALREEIVLRGEIGIGTNAKALAMTMIAVDDLAETMNARALATMRTEEGAAGETRENGIGTVIGRIEGGEMRRIVIGTTSGGEMNGMDTGIAKENEVGIRTEFSANSTVAALVFNLSTRAVYCIEHELS